jgi:hypothetical protein
MASVLRRAPRAIGSLITLLLKTVGDIIAGTWFWTESWLLDTKKSLYGLAVTRILIGLTGVGLLLTNFSSRLYTFGSGSAWNGELEEPVSDFPKIWLFSWFHQVAGNDALFTLLYLLLLALAVAITVGWRFKIVLPFYFVLWISFIEMNDAVGDQGDNMYRIVLLLMLFADPAARWSFDASRRAKKNFPTLLPREISNLLHNLALVALTAQVIFVYTSGGLFKAGGDPWQDGSAVYTPLMTERFGTWPMLSEFFTSWGPAVAAISWGSIILQVCFPLALLTRPTRIIALFGIMSFHIGIGVLMGLPWFSLAMIGIDFIFIRDRTWMKASDLVVGAFRDDDDRRRPSVAVSGDEDPREASSDSDEPRKTPLPAGYAK